MTSSTVTSNLISPINFGVKIIWRTNPVHSLAEFANEILNTFKLC